MRDIKLEVMFWFHNAAFERVIGKHYTSVDRLINGEDSFPHSDMEIICKRQFTGLKVKGSVEIYDGDILSFDWRYQSGELYSDDCKSIIGVVSHCGGRFIVSFFDGAMQFDLHDINQNTFERFWKAEYNSAKSEYFKMVNFMVIGNTYENKDLLK